MPDPKTESELSPSTSISTSESTSQATVLKMATRQDPPDQPPRDYDWPPGETPIAAAAEPRDARLPTYDNNWRVAAEYDSIPPEHTGPRVVYGTGPQAAPGVYAPTARRDPEAMRQQRRQFRSMNTRERDEWRDQREAALVAELAPGRDRYDMKLNVERPGSVPFLNDQWERMNPPNEVYDLTQHVNLEFQDIFTEPEFYLVKGKIFGDALGNRAIRMAWNSVYTYVQLGLYYIIVITLGVFISLGWAVIYAVNSFVIVWGIHPLWKLAFTWVRVGGLMWRLVVRTVLEPIMGSIGLTLSFFRGRFQLHHTGFETLDTDLPPKLRVNGKFPRLETAKAEKETTVHL